MRRDPWSSSLVPFPSARKNYTLAFRAEGIVRYLGHYQFSPSLTQVTVTASWSSVRHSDLLIGYWLQRHCTTPAQPPAGGIRRHGHCERVSKGAKTRAQMYFYSFFTRAAGCEGNGLECSCSVYIVVIPRFARCNSEYGLLPACPEATPEPLLIFLSYMYFGPHDGRSAAPKMSSVRLESWAYCVYPV